jgi:hypothetical protein
MVVGPWPTVAHVAFMSHRVSNRNETRWVMPCPIGWVMPWETGSQEKDPDPEMDPDSGAGRPASDARSAGARLPVYARTCTHARVLASAHRATGTVHLTSRPTLAAGWSTVALTGPRMATDQQDRQGRPLAASERQQSGAPKWSGPRQRAPFWIDRGPRARPDGRHDPNRERDPVGDGVTHPIQLLSVLSRAALSGYGGPCVED